MSNYLNNLNFPTDLANLNNQQLAELAEEIRERLVSVVSKSGGHLSANLGVVELTMALYCVYNPFKDKIIWDVGHQSYVHKILTGRNTEMDTIRSEGGISGFPKRSESIADSFNTGHSSTSISAAIGMARARDLLGEKYEVVAVIGDGALTSGMAFEALNDSMHTMKNLVLILNDNGMAISKNVGGMSQYLGKIRTRDAYISIKKGTKTFLSYMPILGELVIRGMHRFKASIKLLLIPGEMFEDFGLKYIGPIDGHDIKALRTAIYKARQMEDAVLVHVITKKGHGYDPAEENPEIFHGVCPFDSKSGKLPNNEGANITFSKNFGCQLSKIAKNDKKVVAVVAAMPLGTGLNDFSEIYPDQFFDVGIAEQHAITMAAGMAAAGLKPVVAIYSTFIQRAYDQIFHDLCLQNLPVVIMLDRAGVAGSDGETHQGIYDLAFLNHMPNITICAPCCVEEQTQMLLMALNNNNFEYPFVIRYPAKDRFKHDTSFVTLSEMIYGKGIFVNTENNFVSEDDKFDIFIAAIGSMVETALEVADILAFEGLKALVFDARFLRPLDYQSIKLGIQCSGCILTLEDGVISGGFGSSISEYLMENKFFIPVEIVGFPNEPVTQGTITQILHRYGMDSENIAQKAKKIINMKVNTEVVSETQIEENGEINDKT